MNGNRVEERRKHFRFPTMRKALYYLEGEKETIKKFDVVNVSYKGLGVTFHSRQAIERCAMIHAGIIVPWQLTPLSITGLLRWMEGEMPHAIGGIELTEQLDNITMVKLF